MTVKELKKNNMPTDIESYKIKYSGGVGKTPTEYAPFMSFQDQIKELQIKRWK